MDKSDYIPYVEINPKKRFGKPCIKGTRITIGDILEMLADGMTQAEITSEHPNLNALQIKAALAYASYNIDRSTAA
jgi:uncharacterized protein (DUF433 family)